ncbi:MAG: leucine-rich repeat protein [Bacteroidales bacterium]|nr:leucine-rich repeat protein [Bacteroidales bacterium]
MQDLYTKLKEAYSEQNLNRITGKLINLQKSKNFLKLREIANRISHQVQIDEEREVRLFSKLIILYHPDKGENIRKEMKILYEKNDIEGLSKYSHILLLDDLENILTVEIDKNIDYSDDYSWDDEQEDGYEFFDITNTDYFEQFDYDNFERTFYNIMKLTIYGNFETDLPPYYLEDFEAFDLSNSNIEFLDGIEHCIHARIIDFSDNEITDLSELWTMRQIEELYVANNQIGYIDALSNLPNLRILDISGNEIDDLSPLFNLQYLEYVKITGNKIPVEQKEQLKKNDVLVVE